MSANTYLAKIGKINYPQHLRDADRVQRQLDVLTIEDYLDKVFEDKQLNKAKELETEFRELAEQWYLDTLHLTAYWEIVLQGKCLRSLFLSSFIYKCLGKMTKFF